MNKTYVEGGLKMIDIHKYTEAIQIKRAKKLTSKNLPIGKSFLFITLIRLPLN